MDERAVRKGGLNGEKGTAVRAVRWSRAPYDRGDIGGIRARPPVPRYENASPHLRQVQRTSISLIRMKTCKLYMFAYLRNANM